MKKFSKRLFIIVIVAGLLYMFTDCSRSTYRPGTRVGKSCRGVVGGDSYNR